MLEWEILAREEDRWLWRRNGFAEQAPPGDRAGGGVSNSCPGHWQLLWWAPQGVSDGGLCWGKEVAVPQSSVVALGLGSKGAAGLRPSCRLTEKQRHGVCVAPR